ncbi:MAG: hypothetical protein KGI71_06530 [Patescibacteria group bacterium]|nr:hypothetical protein [Patescibacteria group bacterium]
MPRIGNVEVLRIPLSYEQDQRDYVAGSTKDALRVNVMDEIANQRRLVSKRPGFGGYTTAAGSAAAPNQGGMIFNGVPYVVNNDNLLTVGSAGNSGASGTSFTSATGPWASAPLGRGGARAIQFNGTLYVMGGFDSFNYYSDLWSTNDGANWTVNTSGFAGPGRQLFGFVQLKGQLFIFGGVGASGNLADVWSSPDGTTWKQINAAAPWGARWNFGYCATNNGIYLFGGQNNAVDLNDVWYSSDGITWTQLAAAVTWSIRNGHVAYAFKNKLYIAGGTHGGAYYNDAYSSPDGINWTQTTAAAFASGRYAMGGCVYAGKMWAMAGFVTGGGSTSDVYSSPDGITWTRVTATPGWSARAYPAVCMASVPNSASTVSYQTPWVIGGYLQLKDAFYGTLNTSVPINVALGPPVTGQLYQFNSFNNGAWMLLKNQSALWVVEGATPIRVTDVGYPSTTVPGVVVLGGFVYVMDPSGLIYNCDINNPFSWPALNIIGADYEADPGVALVKYLNYVVALGTYTTQFFYDAGLSNGSPLRPYLAANTKTGCADPNSIAPVGSTFAFISATQQSHRQAVMFNGLSIVPFSTPAIEEYLNNSLSYYAVSLVSKGQLFYVVNCATLIETFAYSFTTKQWYKWDAAFAAQQFIQNLVNIAGEGQNLIPKQGPVSYYTLSDTAYWDAGVNFTVQLQTVPYDAGTKRRKFWGRLDVVGDQNASTPSISWTDDDYQTFSTPRTVDLSTQRPALFACGSSFRRAWLYQQTDTSAMRLEALEVSFEVGE